MNLDFTFFFNSILLGIGLAMDAFSVSLANGLNEPCMPKRKIISIASVFALFQFAMPMLGWVFVSTMADYFSAFEKLIPWIALVLLCYIGGKMLYEGIKCGDCEECRTSATLSAILVQGIATSIDALSVGFTISDYNVGEAFLSTGLIGVVTLFICLAGILIGRTAGTKLAGKAGIFGGAILISIGLEIFVTGIFNI